MNYSICKTPLHRPDYKLHHRGWGMDWDLGQAYAHYCIWNGWYTGTCYIAQEALPNILWSLIWEKNLKKRVDYEYMYNWITLLYSRYHYNFVYQPYFNRVFKIWTEWSVLLCIMTLSHSAQPYDIIINCIFSAGSFRKDLILLVKTHAHTQSKTN